MQARKQAEDEDHRIPTSKTLHGVETEHARVNEILLHTAQNSIAEKVAMKATSLNR